VHFGWSIPLATAAGLLATSPLLASDGPSTWSAWSASPVPIDRTTLSRLEEEALARCGGSDAGLAETARVVLGRKLRGLPIPEFDDLARAQRAAGEPHPWARAWVASGVGAGTVETMAKLDSWLGPAPDGPPRRCGVASGVEKTGARVLAVVSIDALADLSPLPTRVRPGEWVTVEARMRVPAKGGEVMVQGPGGPPRSLPTSFDGALVRARFAADRAGEFQVQVMADVEGGPRPVLEATVFAGVEPEWSPESSAAPGEELSAGAVSDVDLLDRMIRAARESMSLPPLRRDAHLDALAQGHAAQMARTGQLAHDAGDGDPFDRLREAGLEARHAGENVAHAATIALAHRALWKSPSHRANLLRRQFDRVGVGIVRDGRGDAWVVELFVGDR
jgi:cysteine-rich secretory family protein